MKNRLSIKLCQKILLTEKNAISHSHEKRKDSLETRAAFR